MGELCPKFTPSGGEVVNIRNFDLAQTETPANVSTGALTFTIKFVVQYQ